MFELSTFNQYNAAEKYNWVGDGHTISVNIWFTVDIFDK